MLLRIEVFPQTGKGGDADADNPKPSQTLYASPATVVNRHKLSNRDKGDANDDDDDDDDDATVDGDDENDHDPNAGLVATIGRKGDVDILFGTDRSISRQHAQLRFVAPLFNEKKKAKRRTTAREKKSDNEGSSENTTTNRGCFMEPRNKDERSGCDDSPYGMCLVLENKGKSGSYIPSKDESVGDDGDEKHNDKKDGADDSDATTDDEGAAVGIVANDSNSLEKNYGTATSLATQMGEIIVSRNNLSPSQKLPSLSDAVRHHFGSNTPVKLMKIDADESRVLNFHDSFGDDCNDNNNNDNDNDNNGGIASENPSILIQFGLAQLPTIKITRIPMTVVFSSGVSSPIQKSLRLCGGLLQEPGALPRRQSNDNTRTTHLVAPERMPVAKQLIAWCYGVPIVSPDFLLALRDHSALKDPFPLPLNFPAKATDTNPFWNWTPDSNLLSNYIMISADPSPEVEQAEGLVEAAGAKLERLYDKQKKHTKAKIQAFLKRAKGLLEEAIDGTNTPQQEVVLLSSKDKSKLSNANTTLLLKQLKEELLIPPVGLKILAKTITKQESVLIGLEPRTRNSSSNKSKGRSKDKRLNDPTITSETALPGMGQSPEWNIRTRDKPNHGSEQRKEACAEKAMEMENHFNSDDSHKPNHKSERREACVKQVMKIENHSYSDDGRCYDGTNSSNNENNNDEGSIVVEEIPSQSRSSRRRRFDHQEQQQQQQQQQIDCNPPSDNDECVKSVPSTSDEPHSTKTFKGSSSNTKGPTAFGRANDNGWCKVAPKDDRERSRWRRRAAEAYQKETGTALESSASTPGDPRIHVAAMTDATNHVSTDRRGSKRNNANTDMNHHRRQNSRNLPNFKKFRKNLIRRADPNEEVVVLLDAGFSQACQAPQELIAEELELRENQRLAEALFKGEPVPGMVKKRRRVRK